MRALRARIHEQICIRIKKSPALKAGLKITHIEKIRR